MSLSFTCDGQGELSYLYEQYHANSKLNARSVAESPSEQEIEFSARSFRGRAGCTEIELPELQHSTFDRLVHERRSRRDLFRRLDVSDVAAIVDGSYGVTAILREGEGPTFALRASPSAGALFPLDLFLVALNVSGLPASVYYFHPLRNSLVNVLGADAKRIAGSGFFDQPWIQGASAIILIGAAFGRLSWKYGERSYRLALLDAGHLGQNILLKAQDLDCPACAIGGFNDQLLAEELTLDGVTEAIVHVIGLGGRENDNDLHQQR